jgi:hypothetical protein
METVTNKSLYKWMRIVHRDIGFFVIGLTIIYCISGIMLTYRDTGFLKSETLVEKTIEPGLQFDQLGRVLHLRDIELIGQDDKEISFSKGTYNKETGVATYLNEEIPELLKAFNGLHVAPSNDARSPVTVIFAGVLLFLAVSSFWMYKPGTRQFKRGIITALSGMAISILLVVL